MRNALASDLLGGADALTSTNKTTAPGLGDDRSVKIKSLEAANIMKIKWLVLGCIEAKFCM